MQEVKQVFIKFPHCQQVAFIENNEKIDAWRKIAGERDVEFIAPEQWHYGTDNGRQFVDYLRGLLSHTTFVLGTEAISIEKENGRFCFVCRKDRKRKTYFGKTVLVSPGRGGAYWFRDVSEKIGVNNNFGPIDVGIRVKLNRKSYDLGNCKKIFRIAQLV